MFDKEKGIEKVICVDWFIELGENGKSIGFYRKIIWILGGFNIILYFLVIFCYVGDG